MTTTDLPASLISTLPGHYYIDAAVFALEQTRIFETMWFCAVRSADLPTPGKFRKVQVGRESVLIVRSRDGQLRAFLNICRHRGAQICTDDSGEVKRAFQCPYHAWTYDLEGKLIAAPNLTKMPDIDRVQYGLVPVHLREWLGYAWVSLAKEPPSFENDVMGAITVGRTVFVNLVPEHVIFHRMFPVAVDRTIVECDWLYTREVVESGKDVSRSVELFHRVNEQDFEACERTQPAMSSRAYANGGVLVPSEHHIGEFHDWLTQRLSD